MVININSSAVVAFTNKLEQMQRSALPNAIRGTLNRAAFDVKQRTMPLSADRHFEKRSPNFFKANSKVQMATGWNVSEMKAVVGFISHNLKYNNYAVKELEDQEYGGEIEKRAFIPIDEARSGGNATPVRPGNRLRAIKGTAGSLSSIPDASKFSGRSKKEKFLRAALSSGSYDIGSHSLVGKRYVIGGGFKTNRKTLYRVNAIDRIGGRMKVKVTPLYSFQEGRAAKIKNDTHFMREASLKSAANMEKYYIAEAERQFAKIK